MILMLSPFIVNVRTAYAQSVSLTETGNGTLMSSNFSTTTPPAVRAFVSTIGEVYTIGEIITYNGRLYRVLQSFTFYGDPNWHPGIAPSLWEFVGLGTSIPGTGLPPMPGARDFIARFGEVYRMGEIIRYNGRLYEVLQTFTFYGDPRGMLKNPMSCVDIAEKSAALSRFSRCDICEWMIFQHFPKLASRYRAFTLEICRFGSGNPNTRT